MSTRARTQTWNTRPATSQPVTGLIGIQNNLSTVMGFKFTGSALLHYAPCTIIDRIYMYQQTGFYAKWWYDSDSNSSFVGDTTYYGPPLYPYNIGQGALGDTGTIHHFEMSMDGTDTPVAYSGLDDNGHSTLCTKGRWYTQALVVTVNGGGITLKNYWDLDAGTNYVVTYTMSSFNDSPASPSKALTYMCDPWPGFQDSETFYGILRGIQQYSAAVPDLTTLTQLAANDSSNTPANSWGVSNVWYMNQNPTPSDIADKSGQGHDPAWLNANRPTLWTGP